MKKKNKYFPLEAYSTGTQNLSVTVSHPLNEEEARKGLADWWEYYETISGRLFNKLNMDYNPESTWNPMNVLNNSSIRKSYEAQYLKLEDEAILNFGKALDSFYIDPPKDILDKNDFTKLKPLDFYVNEGKNEYLDDIPSIMKWKLDELKHSKARIAQTPIRMESHNLEDNNIRRSFPIAQRDVKMEITEEENTTTIRMTSTPKKFFETASFHIVKPCNMRCKFCYATFDDMHVGPQISLLDTQTIIAKLKMAGLEKITFAGGEPMLYKHLDEAIKFSKKIGLTTSIITNGSLLTTDWLRNMRPYLDWIGVSVDSMDTLTNGLIGRETSRSHVSYYQLVDNIQHLGYKLKINTVVNAYNCDEDMNDFIKFAKPDRWKVFQALRVEGQNDKQFDEVKVTPEQFDAFLERHKTQKSLVPENNEAMTGSYLLIDPIGRLFENSAGKHTYSDPLQDNSISDCLEQINLDRDMFVKRGGIYKW